MARGRKHQGFYQYFGSRADDVRQTAREIREGKLAGDRAKYRHRREVLMQGWYAWFEDLVMRAWHRGEPRVYERADPVEGWQYEECAL